MCRGRPRRCARSGSAAAHLALGNESAEVACIQVKISSLRRTTEIGSVYIGTRARISSSMASLTCACSERKRRPNPTDSECGG